ncbi:MAG: acetate kinase [Aeriscardovia sp.]|nr:acetate kinase [Aeriscardovia sp.]
MSENILVVNSGSSSIKYQLLDMGEETLLAKGSVEKIGQPCSKITHKSADKEVTKQIGAGDHFAAFEAVLEAFKEFGPDLDKVGLKAIGNRVVQGAGIFPGPALIDKEVLKKIWELSVLAPLHNGPEARGIEIMQRLFPQTPQVAVFDTSFFFHLPQEARTYALKKEVAERYGIYRYGAHGISHEFVGAKARLMEAKEGEDFRQIVLHLGNGSSCSAQVNAKAVETSMGLTPLEGLVMGTRTGDIDPASVTYLLKNSPYTPEGIEELYNKESGIKGLCGESDMRKVKRLYDAGSKDALLAVRVFCHRIVSYIGAYWAQMGGLDALTFTAGIGENQPFIRSLVAGRLAPFGVKLNEESNLEGSGDRLISSPASSVKVLVIHTDEGLSIARQTRDLLSASSL